MHLGALGSTSRSRKVGRSGLRRSGSPRGVRKSSGPFVGGRGFGKARTVAGRHLTPPFGNPPSSSPQDQRGSARRTALWTVDEGWGPEPRTGPSGAKEGKCVSPDVSSGPLRGDFVSEVPCGPLSPWNPRELGRPGVKGGLSVRVLVLPRYCYPHPNPHTHEGRVGPSDTRKNRP